MFSKLLITIIYLVIALELIFDDSLIAVRYIHFSYLAFFILSTFLLIYFIVKKQANALWFIPAFLFISVSYLSPFITTTPTSKHDTKQAIQAPIKVMSYSVNSRNKDYDKVSQLLANNPADIICLQEIPHTRYELFKKKMLAAGLTYQHVYAKKTSLMILSKHPITPNKTMPYLQASVQIAGKDIKIWNLHSPKSLTAVNYQRYYFDKLYEDVNADKSPSKLICGDFNSTPHNNILPLFTDKLQPAYRQSNSLPSLTYPTVKGIVPSPIPLIKIDYLLFSHNFKIDQYQRLAQYANSDHYPITAIVSFEENVSIAKQK